LLLTGEVTLSKFKLLLALAVLLVLVALVLKVGNVSAGDDDGGGTGGIISVAVRDLGSRIWLPC